MLKLHLNLVFFFGLVNNGWTQSPSIPQPLELNVIAELKGLPVVESGLPLANMEIDLGAIEPKKKYLIHLQVKNPLEQDLVFNRINSSCGCGKILVEKGLVSALKTTSIEAELATPSSSLDGRFGFNAIAMQNEVPVIEFYFRCRLKNNLHLERDAFFQVGSGLEEFRVPIHFTAPITAATLSIDKAKSLSDIQISIVEENSNAFLRILVEPNSFAGSVATGAVTVISDSGIQASTHVMISRKLPIKVSPQTLRFRKIGTNNFHVCTIMIQIDAAQPESGQFRDNQEPAFEFLLGDLRLESKIKMLSKKIFRVELKVADDSIPKLVQSTNLNCQVSIKSEDLNLKQQVPVLIE